ncbi:hypothetical protein DFH07DRAFT_804525 [Mycena maculata]|uniref:Uncharacterized protein n=1 Tax=Mycena maculata TaxID=230809 RepID=A0AAD7JV90_9AGAR|nr:hypothetical protein DFH07DRAFT_804525 [Mycena maculata]
MTRTPRPRRFPLLGNHSAPRRRYLRIGHEWIAFYAHHHIFLRHLFMEVATLCVLATLNLPRAWSCPTNELKPIILWRDVFSVLFQAAAACCGHIRVQTLAKSQFLVSSAASGIAAVSSLRKTSLSPGIRWRASASRVWLLSRFDPLARSCCRRQISYTTKNPSSAPSHIFDCAFHCRIDRGARVRTRIRTDALGVVGF